MEPLKTPEEIFEVAFAYMRSKALFSGLHLGVFDALARGPRSFDALLAATGAEARGLETLLTALVSLGLIERVQPEAPTVGAQPEMRFANAPASQAMLVASPEGGFSDYCRHQIDRQMYPFLHNLHDALRGRRDAVPYRDYETWFRDASEANLYSASQHSVSLPAAALFSALIDLSQATRLLDVGGGSGAFSITLCQRHPSLKATIIDFPSVAEVGRGFVAEAGLDDRVDFLCGNALSVDWPRKQDAVLFSYVSGSVAAEGVHDFYRRAHAALAPGGRVFVHDFIVDDDRHGPPLPALWALQHAAFTPGGVSLTPGFISHALVGAGFSDVEIVPFLPGMTRLVSARKPVGAEPG